MKTSVMVGVVAGAHVVGLSALLLIQGCGTPRVSSLPSSEPPMPKLGEDELPSTPAAPPRVAPAPRPVAVTAAPAPEAEQTTTYVVGPNESLSVIASRFHLKTKDIAALNGITDPNKIRVGQKLRLPGKIDVGAVPPPAPKKKEPAKVKAPAAAAPVAAVVPVAGGQEYVVKSGDSLSKIAAAHGIKTSALRQANGLAKDNLRIGQKLIIPAGGAPAAAKPAVAAAVPAAPAVRAASVPPAAAAAAPVVGASGAGLAKTPAAEPVAAVGGGRPYTVGEGEDLYSVSLMWNVSVADLQRVNGLTETTLKPGQVLKIPSVE